VLEGFVTAVGNEEFWVHIRWDEPCEPRINDKKMNISFQASYGQISLSAWIELD
jgi:hypothetical protein